MANKTISRMDFWKLLGLFVLAKEHNLALREIQCAAAEILSVDEESSDYFGHLSDAVWDFDPNANELLRQLNIKVVEK